MAEFPCIWIGWAESAFGLQSKHGCHFLKEEMLRRSIALIAWMNP